MEIATKCVPKSPPPQINKTEPGSMINVRKRFKKEELPTPTKFKTLPLTSNLITFKALEAKAQKTIKEAMGESWKKYVGKLPQPKLSGTW